MEKRPIPVKTPRFFDFLRTTNPVTANEFEEIRDGIFARSAYVFNRCAAPPEKGRRSVEGHLEDVDLVRVIRDEDGQAGEGLVQVLGDDLHALSRLHRLVVLEVRLPTRRNTRRPSTTVRHTVCIHHLFVRNRYTESIKIDVKYLKKQKQKTPQKDSISTAISGRVNSDTRISLFPILRSSLTNNIVARRVRAMGGARTVARSDRWICRWRARLARRRDSTGSC